VAPTRDGRFWPIPEVCAQWTGHNLIGTGRVRE
jgi:hypothetical protein